MPLVNLEGQNFWIFTSSALFAGHLKDTANAFLNDLISPGAGNLARLHRDSREQLCAPFHVAKMLYQHLVNGQLPVSISVFSILKGLVNLWSTLTLVPVFLLQKALAACFPVREVPLPPPDKVKPWDDSQEFKIIKMKAAKITFDEEDELAKEFQLAEGQFLRLKGLKNKKIQSIDLVYNKKLEAKFEAKKEELKKQGKVESLLVFHGTPQKNIRPILENNFDLTIVANGRALGDGVYFSEQPEVSLGYSRDQKSLILCKVLKAGNCTEYKGKEMTRSWAIVVPDVDQILPKYVINFS